MIYYFSNDEDAMMAGYLKWQLDKARDSYRVSLEVLRTVEDAYYMALTREGDARPLARECIKSVRDYLIEAEEFGKQRREEYETHLSKAFYAEKEIGQMDFDFHSVERRRRRR